MWLARHIRRATTGMIIGLGGLAAVTLAPCSAAAQDSAPNAYLSPEETRECLCLEEQVNGMRSELDASKQAREQVAAEFARLDALVEQARLSIDVNDPAETDSFRRLFYRREELRQELNQVSQPHDRILRRYNQVAKSYNSLCANRKMFKVNVDAVRADLQCDATP